MGEAKTSAKSDPLFEKTRDLTTLNPVLQGVLAERTVVSDDGSSLPLESEISIDEGFFLQDIIRQMKPRVSLEIGCAYGIASLFICQALTEIGAERHIIIDPFQMVHAHVAANPGWNGVGLTNLRRAGYGELISFHEELSYRCLPCLERESCRLDFAFIDGMHTFDYALVDFFYIDKMLNVGGIIVLDDLLYPSIRKLSRYILRNLAYNAVGPTPVPRLGKARWAERAAQVPILNAFARDDLSIPDFDIGVPQARYIALQKMSADKIGDGREFTRRWDTHHRF